MNWQEFTEKTKETAVYPGSDARVQPNVKAVVYLALGLAGETGETVDLIKKQWRKTVPGRFTAWHDPAFLANVQLELGDVFWYAAQLMEQLGLDFEEVLQANLDKLAQRKAEGTLKERRHANQCDKCGHIHSDSDGAYLCFICSCGRKPEAAAEFDRQQRHTSGGVVLSAADRDLLHGIRMTGSMQGRVPESTALGQALIRQEAEASTRLDGETIEIESAKPYADGGIIKGEGPVITGDHAGFVVPQRLVPKGFFDALEALNRKQALDEMVAEGQAAGGYDVPMEELVDPAERDE